jgi:surfactin synthase thioesterase subunit
MTIDDRWLRRFHDGAAQGPRLVCFPHAGGSASFFFPFSEALHDRADVLAVQYPGRQDRWTEPCLLSIAELAEQVFHALEPHVDRPIVLFGHSMGSLVAFETARRLEARLAVSPAALVVSALRAPSRKRDEHVHEMDDAGVLDELRLLEQTASSLLDQPELRAMILPPVRGDYTAFETYQVNPGATVDCPITMLFGASDPKTTRDEAQAWAGHTTAGFTLRTFAGGHFYLNDHLPAVLDTVRALLPPATARHNAAAHHNAAGGTHP